MTPRTTEETLNCVDSTVFAEVELTHHWTLQPPLAAYRDIHRSISVCSWCGARSQRGVRRKLPAPRLPNRHRRDPRLLAVHLRRSDGTLQLHGLQPSLQQMRTPVREWRSLRQLRRPQLPEPATPAWRDCQVSDSTEDANPGSPGRGISAWAPPLPAWRVQPGTEKGSAYGSQPPVAQRVGVLDPAAVLPSADGEMTQDRRR